MPNQFSHSNQEEAASEMNRYRPLVKVNCFPDLKYFICGMYAPICIENYTKPLFVCRSLCERAKAGCENLMNKFGFFWPNQLDCEKLPASNEYCMEAILENSSGQKKLSYIGREKMNWTDLMEDPM